MRRWSALPIRIAVTLVAVLIAALIGWRLWVYYELSPWTRDARISADVRWRQAGARLPVIIIRHCPDG